MSEYFKQFIFYLWLQRLVAHTAIAVSLRIDIESRQPHWKFMCGWPAVRCSMFILVVCCMIITCMHSTLHSLTHSYTQTIVACPTKKCHWNRYERNSVFVSCTAFGLDECIDFISLAARFEQRCRYRILSKGQFLKLFRITLHLWIESTACSLSFSLAQYPISCAFIIGVLWTVSSPWFYLLSFDAKILTKSNKFKVTHRAALSACSLHSTACSIEKCGGIETWSVDQWIQCDLLLLLLHLFIYR